MSTGSNDTPTTDSALLSEQSGVRCIFCDENLDGTTKPEHVLLSALGGRKTTRRAICSNHNNAFGCSIDKVLSEQVPMLRNMLQMESGVGKSPPSVMNIQSGDRRINLKPGGIPEIVAKPFVITKLPNGNSSVQIMVRSEEELERVIPHIAAALSMDEKALRQLVVNSSGKIVRGYTDPIHFQLALGGPDAIRSMVKSCMVLLATKVGTEPLRTDAFAETRTFVLEGGREFNTQRLSLDPRLLPEQARLEQDCGPLFNLIYVRSDDLGRTIGHFTLYNLMAWQIVLAESGVCSFIDLWTNS